MNKTKTYYLSEQEKTNILSRKSLLEEHQYMTRLIQADLDRYVLGEICGRLKIPPSSNIRLNDVKGTLEIDEPITPNGQAK